MHVNASARNNFFSRNPWLPLLSIRFHCPSMPRPLLTISGQVPLCTSISGIEKHRKDTRDFRDKKLPAAALSYPLDADAAAAVAVPRPPSSPPADVPPRLHNSYPAAEQLSLSLS